jgi:hypothetical protein
MTRYARGPKSSTRAPAGSSCDTDAPPGGLYDYTLDVYPGEEWEPTGVLDASGAMLYRSEKAPLGFRED